MFYVNVPSVLDESMRVDGDEHVFSLEVLYTPYRCRAAGTVGGAATLARAVRDRSSSPASSTASGAGGRDPAGYEREFNLPRGHARRSPAGPLRRCSAQARAHPLRDADQRPLPHRRGHVPRCRRVGRQPAATPPPSSSAVLIAGRFGSRRARSCHGPRPVRRSGSWVAPRELDPAVGLAPHVLALHDRARLLVEHRASAPRRPCRGRTPSRGEGVAGVGDVVGDEHRASVRSTSSGVGGRIIGTSRRSSMPV